MAIATSAATSTAASAHAAMRARRSSKGTVATCRGGAMTTSETRSGRAFSSATSSCGSSPSCSA